MRFFRRQSFTRLTSRPQGRAVSPDRTTSGYLGVALDARATIEHDATVVGYLGVAVDERATVLRDAATTGYLGVGVDTRGVIVGDTITTGYLSLGLDMRAGTVSRDAIAVGALYVGSAGYATVTSTKTVTGALYVGSWVQAILGEFPTSVPASAETAVPGGASGDVADTPWIWHNRADPEASFILGSNKSTGSDGGVYTYNIDGSLASITHWLIGAVNAVNGRDLGYVEYANVHADWDDRVLVIGTNRTDNDLNYGFMDRDTGEITDAGATSLAFEPYGCTLYVSPSTGDVYAFVSEATGGGDALRQYELTISGDTVSGTQVRVLDTDSLAEGMCTWEPEEWFFLTEEDEGLYRYDAEPDGGTSRVEVDHVSGPNLAADVEGVAIIAPYAGDPGYIIVASQGDSTFAMYDLADPHGHVVNFTVTANGGIDATSGTDGIDAARLPFGSTWPNGIIIVHDETNTGGAASNFKIVDAGDLFGELPELNIETIGSLFLAVDERATVQSEKIVTGSLFAGSTQLAATALHESVVTGSLWVSTALYAPAAHEAIVTGRLFIGVGTWQTSENTVSVIGALYVGSTLGASITPEHQPLGLLPIGTHVRAGVTAADRFIDGSVFVGSAQRGSIVGKEVAVEGGVQVGSALRGLVVHESQVPGYLAAPIDLRASIARESLVIGRLFSGIYIAISQFPGLVIVGCLATSDTDTARVTDDSDGCRRTMDLDWARITEEVFV